MTINITLANAARMASSDLIDASTIRASETLATPGTASGVTAQADEVWDITAEVDLWVQFGSAPTGVAPRVRMKSGQTRMFRASAGQKVAYATT